MVNCKLLFWCTRLLSWWTMYARCPLLLLVGVYIHSKSWMCHMLLTHRIWCHHWRFLTAILTRNSHLIQIIVCLMWTLHLIFHIRCIWVKVILYYLARIIYTLFIIDLVILRYFWVLLTYWFLWRFYSIILHALSKIFVRKVIITLNSTSLSRFFLLPELKFTLIRLITFINGHSTMVWLFFFLIINNRCSFNVDIISLLGSFLFKVTLTMNLLYDFLVVILYLFDFSF